MNTWIIALFVLIALTVLAHFLIAGAASVALFQDRSLSPSKRARGYLLAWLVPYVGGLVLLRLINEYSPELVPSFVKKSPFLKHIVAPVQPAPHKLGKEWGPGEDVPLLRTEFDKSGFGSDIGLGGDGAGGD